MNSIGIITFVNHLHVCVTKFKPSFMFFKLSVPTRNNVIWLNFSTILFYETQYIVKTSTTGYVPVCYEVINLFIEPQNFLLMFLICKLKDLYLIVTACDGLFMVFLHFVCKLLPNMRKQHIAAVSPEVFCLWLLTWKYYLIHPLFFDVIVVFSRVLGSIVWGACSRHLDQLPLMSEIFRVDMSFLTWAVLVALPYSSVLHTSLARIQGFSLMVTSHKSTALKETGMTEDIFIKFRAPAKLFLIYRQALVDNGYVWN